MYQTLLSKPGLPVIDLFATPRQQSGPSISVVFSNRRGSRDGCSSIWMAPRAPLRFSTLTSHASIPKVSKGRSNSGGPPLAKMSVVPRHNSTHTGNRVENSSQDRSIVSRSTPSSPSRTVPSDSTEVEQQALAKKGYSAKILDTLLASKKSMAKVYINTWKKFRSWCLVKGLSPLKVKTKHILELLQDGLDKGLSTSTLRWQVVAL